MSPNLIVFIFSFLFSVLVSPKKSLWESDGMSCSRICTLLSMYRHSHAPLEAHLQGMIDYLGFIYRYRVALFTYPKFSFVASHIAANSPIVGRTKLWKTYLPEFSPLRMIWTKPFENLTRTMMESSHMKSLKKFWSKWIWVLLLLRSPSLFPSIIPLPYYKRCLILSSQLTRTTLDSSIIPSSEIDSDTTGLRKPMLNLTRSWLRSSVSSLRTSLLFLIHRTVCQGSFW